MISYIRSAVTGCGGNTIMPASGGSVDHYDRASAAYTVVKGRLRAVMLHNYPHYSHSSLSEYSATMSFFEKEVDYAVATKSYLMVFMHDMGDHMKWKMQDPNFKKFADLIARSRVIAIFAGHWHW